jgi:hypothetical protein
VDTCAARTPARSTPELVALDFAAVPFGLPGRNGKTDCWPVPEPLAGSPPCSGSSWVGGRSPPAWEAPASCGGPGAFVLGLWAGGSGLRGFSGLSCFAPAWVDAAGLGAAFLGLSCFAPGFEGLSNFGGTASLGLSPLAAEPEAPSSIS